jgi:hypothetical protein
MYFVLLADPFRTTTGGVLELAMWYPALQLSHCDAPLTAHHAPFVALPLVQLQT